MNPSECGANETRSFYESFQEAVVSNTNSDDKNQSYFKNKAVIDWDAKVYQPLFLTGLFITFCNNFTIAIHRSHRARSSFSFMDVISVSIAQTPLR